MGDVYPLGDIVGMSARHVRMMLLEKRPPGDLNSLEAGVNGQLEAGVQIVVREHRAWRHRRQS
jgi:hypothetical protein